ncbi:hypothetical protein TVAG_419560 [Trichomonas vaginalis G3]|uniref:Initiator binding domain-containing protein n=1 Tax=Trichomonas vaginalis (strain ATCC PRA-98 / G3) TaxID=412133 RepID=A2EIT0_TRIV3|nr:transcription-initiator DNA-binding domain ibd family [Trichomonas vaginalis G3]EAY07414.1 hypothetical protein TVAG_419560 [Trichomonas vaginalis G3]KAI5484624.1 transcription-initiator DNA-binding domain ibd family [Trichomonas vaginalis G3]|eukprot:XP_001319637.1 hypothetical protein [Trichomonas vaginalis G3]
MSAGNTNQVPYFQFQRDTQNSTSGYPFPVAQRIPVMQPISMFHPHVYSTPPPDYAQDGQTKVYQGSKNQTVPIQFNLPVQQIPVQTQQFEPPQPQINGFETQMLIYPSQIGLIPHDFWRRYETITFQQMVDVYFHKRNSSPYRFTFKLYNALLLTEKYPNLLHLVGATWQTNKILKIYKTPFSCLIGTRVANNSLFHKQGNFPTHGFAELTTEEALAKNIDIRQIDFDEIRLLHHVEEKFYRHCGEKVINLCIWIGNYNSN